MLQILSEEKLKAFYQSFIGTNAKVLFEDYNNNGIMYGFTENYIKVEIEYNPNLSNRIADVNLLEINDNGNVKVKLIDEKSFKFKLA